MFLGIRLLDVLAGLRARPLVELLLPVAKAIGVNARASVTVMTASICIVFPTVKRMRFLIDLLKRLPHAANRSHNHADAQFQSE